MQCGRAVDGLRTGRMVEACQSGAAHSGRLADTWRRAAGDRRRRRSGPARARPDVSYSEWEFEVATEPAAAAAEAGLYHGGAQGDRWPHRDGLTPDQ